MSAMLSSINVLRKMAATRAVRVCLPTPLAPARSASRAPKIHPAGAIRLQSNKTSTAGGANDYQFGPSNTLQPQPATQRVGNLPSKDDKKKKSRDDDDDEPSVEGNAKQEDRGNNRRDGTHELPGTAWKMFEAAATTAASLAILGLAGYGYHRYYKHITLAKIDHAFCAGDPALKLAGAGAQPWIHIDEQERINDIVTGKEHGHYYLLIGEKGTGKTSMILRAMHTVDGDGISMMEAHSDPEIFRIRLGKALDFEFHEDYIGSLFSIRGPRETTALLDIERALNKLEKVALERRKCGKVPLVMIINGAHMIRNNDVGRDLLELLQQRAEAWAAAGLVTMVFNSDDYWVYERLKQYGSRMEVMAVRDLSKSTAIAALKGLRTKIFAARNRTLHDTDADYEHAYQLIGGRLAFLTKAAKAKKMIRKCEEICETEKAWLLNQCWILGMSMDDDVMDQQKYASSAMMLVKYLVDEDNKFKASPDYNPNGEHRLPEIPLHKAREVMTRADFIEQYDHDNLFTIDSKANVRADSVPMMRAFREIANEPEFAAFLEETMERIGDIESLGRTREVSLKDLWNGGQYDMVVKDHKGRLEKSITLNTKRGRKAVQGNDGSDEEQEREKEEEEAEK